MASDLIRTGIAGFIKSEDGRSAAAKGPPTCSAELASSASGSADDLADNSGSGVHVDVCSLDRVSERDKTVETALVNLSSGRRECDRGRPTCGVTLSRPGASDEMASVQAQTLPVVAVNTTLSCSDSSSSMNPPRHLPQQLSSPAGQAGDTSGPSAAGTPRPQTLLPTTLDLPLAEAVALLTNGFNRDSSSSSQGILTPLTPLSVSTPAQHSTVGLPVGALTSPLASPGVTQPTGSAAERRKQQKRLLKKLQSAVLEYHTRLGEECAVVASIRPDSASNFASPEEARDVVIFGSQILENALQLQYNSISHTIKHHNHHISLAASAAALSTTSAATPVASTPSSPVALTSPCSVSSSTATSHLLPLPPRDVDLMNGNELKSYVPLLLRSLATGRARPMWGSLEHCPPWWPSDVPFRNVRMDTRAANARGDKTWSDCLRQAVKACFRYHGCEELLRDLPKESSNQKAPMVQVTLTSQKGLSTEPAGFSAKRSVNLPTNTGRDSDVHSPHFTLPGTLPVVPNSVPFIPSATPVGIGNSSLPNTLSGIPTSLPPGMSVLPPVSMPQLSLLPYARQLRVHFKNRAGTESCEVISVHPSLTSEQILEHFGCTDSEYQLLTAYTGGSIITGSIWPVCDKQSDIFLVKRPDPLLAG